MGSEVTYAIITGSCGLVGSEATRFFADKGYVVVGIDNDGRKQYFGSAASTRLMQKRLQAELGERYHHRDVDIRSLESIRQIFRVYGNHIGVVIHAAAQPSHDWGTKNPLTDFSVNAVGTLNVLESCREYAPEAAFIYVSTNKVYGNTPNYADYTELATRFEIVSPKHEQGFDETTPIDQSIHSVFGCSKLAGDVLVQEYGRNHGMKTVCFRCGCITGADHQGVELHGFLAYLMICAVENKPYTIYGFKGKQVRDNIHASDLVAAFWAYLQNPRNGEVYNMGGGRDSNCSLLEALEICQTLTGREMRVRVDKLPRTGDHIWYISDLRKFRHHYPDWQLKRTVPDILEELYAARSERAVSPQA